MTRKGARSVKDIPETIMKQINEGRIETANLTEWLAVNQTILADHVLRQLHRPEYVKTIISRTDQLKKQTVNTRNETIGETLLALTIQNNDQELFQLISTHTSDTVRCWATYMIAKNSQYSLQEKLEKIKYFAADTHFGVREISWLSLRPEIAEDIANSIALLSEWTVHNNANIRRFASEATRPRGVWCAHIEQLKKTPELGLSILEPLKSDSARYVQDSVGNWLNDAGKTRADFVKELCDRWTTESPTKETAYIIRKALRSIDS